MRKQYGLTISDNSLLPAGWSEGEKLANKIGKDLRKHEEKDNILIPAGWSESAACLSPTLKGVTISGPTLLGDMERPEGSLSPAGWSEEAVCLGPTQIGVTISDDSLLPAGWSEGEKLANKIGKGLR